MKLRNKALLLSVMALSGAGLGTFKNAQAQEAGAVIKPSSAWAVTKVSQGAEPYCTLVRQYDGGVVITLGQNYNEEYSLAIDFQKPKFDPEKSYPLTLQPGPGQLRAYEMIPASPGAMVVRLGWDESFLAALADSQMLKAEIDKEEYNFSFPDFVTGEKDLAGCMNALKEDGKPPETRVASADAPEKAPVDKADFKAKKVETKKAAPVDKKASRVVKAVTPSPREVKADAKKLNKMTKNLSALTSEKEKLDQALEQEKQKSAALEKALKQKNSGTQDAQKNLQDQLKAITTEKDALAAEQQKVAGQVATLTAEKSALESKLAEKTKGTSEEVKAIEAMKAEVSSLQEQNKTLSVALKQQEATAMKKAAGVAGTEIVGLKADVTKLTDENVALVAENQSLKDLMAAKEKATPVSITPDNTAELAKAQADLAAALSEKSALTAELAQVKTSMTSQAVSGDELTKIQADLAAALSEKDSLLAELAQVKTELIAKPDVSAETLTEIASLQKDLEAAKASIALKDKELADVSEKANEAKSEKTVILEKRVAELEAESKKYYEDTRVLRSEVDNAKIELSNQTFKKVKKLEDKLEAAMSDNISLTKQVEELSRMQDDVAIGIADGDWNLEKATRRFNEAEKEVRRLGSLLEQQRGGFRAEEKKLEEMLFDPAVADKKQRQKLAELERELNEARRLLAQRGVTPQERTTASRGGNNNASVTPMPRSPAVPVERVSSITPAAAPTPAPAPVSRTPVAPRVSPQPMAPVASGGTFGQTDIQSIISKAGIGASSVTSAGANAYRWNAGGMSGYAQVVPKSQAGDAVQYAQNYINQQRSRCQGDFASVPGNSGRGKTTYEIACVGGNASTSSSLVFFEKSGSVTMIAHQTSADDMDVAMDARDKVASQIK